MYTLAAPASAEFTVRQSRFIAHAAAVGSEAATLAFYESVADPSASHNCWAWRVAGRYRFNDDGEPGGTAGRPILGVIESRELDHVMVVVTRHFGGIKLGSGGLVRAYSGITARCLDRAEIVTIHPLSQAVVEAGFEWTGPVHAALEACQARVLEEAFTPAGLSLSIEVRSDRLRRLDALLRGGTHGMAHLRRR